MALKCYIDRQALQKYDTGILYIDYYNTGNIYGSNQRGDRPV